MYQRWPIIILLTVLVGYGFLKAWPLLSGPELSLSSLSVDPSDGSVSFAGLTKHTATLTFDGGTLLIDESGHFSDALTLPRGGTELTFTATDRFGRNKTVQKELIVP